MSSGRLLICYHLLSSESKLLGLGDESEKERKGKAGVPHRVEVPRALLL